MLTKMSTKKKISKNYLGKNPRKIKKERNTNKCPCCGAAIQLVTESEMNFRFTSNPDLMYWRCKDYPRCNTYIAADPRTKKPSGLMGGPVLRYKRMCIHHWEERLIRDRIMDKKSFRDMCASQIGFRKEGMVHTRNMTEFECDAILKHLEKLYHSQPRIHDMVERYVNSSMWKQVRGINQIPGTGETSGDEEPVEKDEFAEETKMISE